jgi:hypothetical protein
MIMLSAGIQSYEEYAFVERGVLILCRRVFYSRRKLVYPVSSEIAFLYKQRSRAFAIVQKVYEWLKIVNNGERDPGDIGITEIEIKLDQLAARHARHAAFQALLKRSMHPTPRWRALTENANALRIKRRQSDKFRAQFKRTRAGKLVFRRAAVE